MDAPLSKRDTYVTPKRPLSFPKTRCFCFKLILYYIRLLGIAPLRIQRYQSLNKGRVSEAKLSHPWQIYSQVLLVFLILPALLVSYFLIFLLPHEDYSRKASTLIKVHSIWILTFLTYVNRKTICDVANELRVFDNYPSALILGCFFFSTLVFGLVTGSFVMRASFRNPAFVLTYGYCLAALNASLLTVTIAFIILVEGVDRRACQIRRAAREIADRVLNGSPDALLPSGAFKSILNDHIELWNCARLLNKAFDRQLLLSAGNMIAQAAFLPTHAHFWRSALVEIGMHLGVFATVCAVTERAGRKADGTAVAVSGALARPGLPPAVREELRDLSVQLLHLRLRFTACGFFPLDYSQLHTVIAAITTYLVILLQTQTTKPTTSAVSSADTASAAAKAAIAAFNTSSLGCSCGCCGSCVGTGGIGTTPRFP